MTRFETRQHNQGLSPSQRIKTCGRAISRHVEFAAISYYEKNSDSEKISVGVAGRATCRSVHCPVCRIPQMIKRKNEVQWLTDHWHKKGYHVSMLTFTAPHYGYMEPVDFFGHSRTRKGLSGAVTIFRESKLWSSLICGHISVVEATFGRKNGMHAHYHVLVATEEPIDHLITEMSMLWQDSCQRADLGKPSLSRGLTVQNADKAAQYISKWSIESEMAGSHVKDAKNGNMTLQELERLSAAGDPWARDMLKAYFKAVYYRRTITYSRNLSEARQAYKEEAKSIWSSVPIFSVDRKETKLSCESEQEIRDILKATDFSNESLEIVARVYDFQPILPEFDKSCTPESREAYEELRGNQQQEYHNVRLLLDIRDKAAKQEQS